MEIYVIKKLAYSEDCSVKTNQIYLTKLNIEMSNLLNDTRVDKVLTIEEFFENYYLIVVGGSYYDEFKESDNKKYQDELSAISKDINLNKRTTGLTGAYELYKMKMNNIFDCKVRLKTKGHQKIQEQTKARSIYQTTFLHYICCAYLFMPIETNIGNENIFMNLDGFANIARYSKRLEKFSKGCVNSFDFEDFNAQHTFEDMQCVLRHTFEKVSSTIEDDNTREKYINIANWVINSVSNTYTYRNGIKYQWKAGLPSGVRYTSYMNNILNYLYTKIMYKSLNSLYPHLNYDYRLMEVCGDDSYHVFSTIEASTIFNEEMLACGYSIQLTKQMTSYETFEFLRLQYYPNGLICGCVNRSISNFVCGNWEDSGSNSVLQIINELYPNVVTLTKRGMSVDIARRIWMMALVNCLVNKSYEQQDFNSYAEMYNKSCLVKNYFNLTRRLKTDQNGYSMLLYEERYIDIKTLSRELSEIRKSLDSQITNEAKDFDYNVTSLIEFRSSLVNWMKMNNVIINDQVDYAVINKNTFNLAVSGAVRISNTYSHVREILKSLDVALIVSTTLDIAKFSNLPQLHAQSTVLALILISDISVYFKCSNFEKKLAGVQSVSSVNMDIIKFWLIRDSLNTNERNKLFRKVFSKKYSTLDKSYLDSVYINNKGKVVSTFMRNPSLILQTIGDSESIMNSCYAVTRDDRYYKCVIIKEMRCRAMKIIIRN